jgi:1-acyl-sn-glycerol-3-phosphate acyltransferase
MRALAVLRRGGAVLSSLLLTWGIAALVASRLSPRTRRRLSTGLARQTLAALGMHMHVGGVEAPADDRPRLFVANHVSWLDVYALGAHWPARFVAKVETASWPLAGTIARRFDSLFIVRGSFRDAARVKTRVAAALAAGDSVIVFPEATTTDGTRLGRFHPAMFQAAIEAGAVIQPVAIRYRTPDGSPCPAAAFVGDDNFAASLCRVLREPAIEVVVHVGRALSPTGWTRRELAARAQAAVAGALGLPPALVTRPYPVRARRIAPAA